MTNEIKAGDHVLLTIEKPDLYLIETMAAALRKSFPGVEFTFIEGVTSALVLRKGDAHD